MQILSQKQLLVQDRIRYSRRIQRLYGFYLLSRGRISRDPVQKRQFLANAWRILVGTGDQEVARQQLAPLVEDPAEAAKWFDLPILPTEPEGRISKGIILKQPDGNERGVLIVSFESNFLNLRACRNFELLAQQYTIILFTSWFPPPYAIIWQFAQLPNSDIYLAVSNPREKQLADLNTGIRRMPFYTCDFINPDKIQPRPRTDRDIDILMVANWAPFKRHWQLFDFLRRSRRQYRTVLIGQPEQDFTVDHIRAQAELFGVADKVDIHERLPIEQVLDMQARSKVSLILSKREGSCKVNAEALFANTPIGLLQGAQIGSIEYVTPDTGRLLRERHFVRDLEQFIDDAPGISPRQWAVENISNRINLQRLNEILKTHASDAGRPWTRDCVMIDWHVVPDFVNDVDRKQLQAAYEQMQQKHGLRFGR